jgi:hypothetical protein
MPRAKNRFVIVVKTDAGDIVPSPSPYDNTWPTRAQAEQESARRDRPKNGGRYIVMETMPGTDGLRSTKTAFRGFAKR